MITQYIIYEHPRDYPDHYVIRAWCLDDEGFLCANLSCELAGSLEEARAHVPYGLCKVNPGKKDDGIVEVWT